MLPSWLEGESSPKGCAPCTSELLLSGVDAAYIFFPVLVYMVLAMTQAEHLQIVQEESQRYVLAIRVSVRGSPAPAKVQHSKTVSNGFPVS